MPRDTSTPSAISDGVLFPTWAVSDPTTKSHINIFLRPIWIPALFGQVLQEEGPDIELNMLKIYYGDIYFGTSTCGREGTETRLCRRSFQSQ